ncbi:MAG: hypothetical protein SYR96_12660 [Actinomycetota bacterium]|nr:hypothetical protein [Actinomycetota bacterium]
MAERPNNIRPSSIIERSYANTGGGHHGRIVLQDRADENQNRSYRGSHRASSQHLADDRTTAEQRRSSRVGRHHAEHSEDLTGRW